MKVSELIKELETLSPDLPVLLSKDAEGNGFKPLDEVSTETYIVWDRYGEIDLVDADEAEDFANAEDVVAATAVVFWP